MNTADFNNVTQVPQIEQVSDAESKDMREQITGEPKETDENSINTEDVVTAVLSAKSRSVPFHT